MLSDFEPSGELALDLGAQAAGMALDLSVMMQQAIVLLELLLPAAARAMAPADAEAASLVLRRLRASFDAHAAAVARLNAIDKAGP
jgi:hypothetical protein